MVRLISVVVFCKAISLTIDYNSSSSPGEHSRGADGLKMYKFSLCINAN